MLVRLSDLDRSLAALPAAVAITTRTEPDLVYALIEPHARARKTPILRDNLIGVSRVNNVIPIAVENDSGDERRLIFENVRGGGSALPAGSLGRSRHARSSAGTNHRRDSSNWLHSYGGIAAQLEARGIRTARGGRWAATQVRHRSSQTSVAFLKWNQRF
jgi:hypothetical protein